MRAVIITLSLLVVLAACTAPTSDEIVLGATLSLSGPGAFWGEHSQNAIEMAVSDINAAGGINGKTVRVVYEDTACDSKTGVSAYNNIKLKGPDFIIGDVCSNVALATAPLAQEDGFFYLTPCSEHPDVTAAGDMVFRTWPTTDRQGQSGASFAYNELGARTVAIMYAQHDYGESLLNSFSEAFTNLGGEIVAQEAHALDVREFQTQLLKVQEANPDVIYVATLHEAALPIVQQIRQFNIDAEILGVSAMTNFESFIIPAGEDANGVYLTDLQDLTQTEFIDRYAQEHGEWPGSTSCAGVAFDGVRLLADALAQSEDPQAVAQYFYAADTQGVSGRMSFNEQGDLERDFNILVIQDGKLELVQ